MEEVKENKKILYHFANFAMFYVYVCAYVRVYMHTCIHACTENINSTVYKSDYSIYFFLLVTIMFDKEFSLKLKNFPSLKRIFFFIIVLKYTQYFT